MNLKEKIAAKKTELESLKKQLNAKTIEFRSAVENSETPEDLNKAKEIRSEVDTLKENLRSLEDEIDLMQEALKGAAVKTQAAKQPTNGSYREQLNEYIRSMGKVVGDELRMDGKGVIVPEELRDITPTTDGVVSATVDKTIPETIVYSPQREVKTVVDLKRFVHVFKANTAKGTYPILKNATSKLIEVSELEKNPALAKPEFTNIDWEIKTYRGAIPISQESIDDSAVDLVSIVNENAQQLKVNTTNDAIATVFKQFTAKDVKNIDDIKTINNVNLDPAYSRSIIASQSFYNALDTLKDNNGRYLLQDSVLSPTGKVFLGMPIHVVSDTVFGSEGDAKAFLGDLDRAIIFPDRKDLTIRWVDNEVYGQYLQAVIRFGTVKADTAAGYFLTYSPK